MRSIPNLFTHLFILASIVLFAMQVSGCASDSYAAKGAGKGATTGAVSGAVGGLVSALVFGGDPGDAMARGAVYGGAVGATAGGMAGAEVDRKIAAEQEAKLQKLRTEIGDEAYEGLAALADCDHSVALTQASKAKQNTNPNFSLAGLWLEALTYSDQGNNAKLSAMYPTVVKQDWNIKTNADAKNKLGSAQNALMDIREQYKLPRVCSTN